MFSKGVIFLPTKNLITGIPHVCIRCRDEEVQKKVVDFYTKVFGLTIFSEWGEGSAHAFQLDTGEGKIEVFADAGENLPRGAVEHFALATADVDKALALAAEAGCLVLKEPLDVELPSVDGVMQVRLAFYQGLGGEKVELFAARLK